MTDRVLQKAKNFVPSLLLTSSPFEEIQDSFSRENLSFEELINRRITGLWDESLFIEQYHKSDVNLEDDSKAVFYALQLRVVKQLKQQFENREQFENALCSDFYSNIDSIRTLDSELQALVPERFMVVGDTRGALEDKNLMEQFIRSVQALEKSRATNRPANQPEQITGKPQFRKVTWSKLSYKGEAYFRGFEAGLVFYGSNFSKELEITHRRIGEIPPDRNYFWQKPNTLSINYAEIATHEDELSSPLGYFGVEFCVRNSETETSDWITFDYPFDWERLSAELDQCENSGQTLYDDARFAEAVESLGRAAFFADRLLGASAERSVKVRNLWHTAIEAAETAKLKFRQGERVKLVSGQHAGEKGEITKLVLRCVQPYEIRLDPKEEVYIFASDNEVESDN